MKFGSLISMSTSLIKPKKSGRNINGLSVMQRMFCEYLAADSRFDAVEAARKAGYKNPDASSISNLRNKKIAGYLGKVLRDRIERCELEAKDVLNHLRNALFLDPADVFEEQSDGSITVKRLSDIPKSVRVCLTDVECKTEYYKGEAVGHHIKVNSMNKSNLMAIAMKHLGLLAPDANQVNVNVNAVPLDYDKLTEPIEEADTVEGRVEKVQEE